MEIRRKKGKIQKRVAVLLSVAFFIGNVWQPSNQMQPIYAAEQLPETELLEKTEQESETEVPEETEQESATEESEETEQESETEVPEETEQESATEESEETEQESETEVPEETEQEAATEEPEETEQESETELLEETELMSETEQESEAKNPEEPEQESETELPEETKQVPETEVPKKPDEFGNTSSGSYWDESWYVKKDFRFVQIPKEYALIEGATTAAIYEQPDAASEVVGEIPYFGIVYVLKEINDQWVYVESGDVRGFLQAAYLTDAAYTENLIDTIGEEKFQVARSSCEKADNTQCH